MPTAFPASLRDLMARRGLTQSALAEASGLRQGAISQWLSGANEPTLGAFVALADALGVTLDQLAGRGKPKRKRAKAAS